MVVIVRLLLVNSTCRRPPFYKQQVDVALESALVSVYFKYCGCFRVMLQVFYLDVAIVIYECCKHLFSMFHLFFQTYIVIVFI
jgi:hypothetical protein